MPEISKLVFMPACSIRSSQSKISGERERGRESERAPYLPLALQTVIETSRIVLVKEKTRIAFDD